VAPAASNDHLISRELGGSDDITNLWTQLWGQANKKDQLENLLHRLLCTNKMPLRTAQQVCEQLGAGVRDVLWHAALLSTAR
jgi:hypothetical protein